jgi:hypothetical protein
MKPGMNWEVLWHPKVTDGFLFQEENPTPIYKVARRMNDV